MTGTRRMLVAGNWKMNGLRADGEERAAAVARHVAGRDAGDGPDVVICPPATLLFPLAAVLGGGPVSLGAQDCHEAEKGAFTGSISATMLREAGCRYAIVGHSERRHGLGETDALVRAKAAAARGHGMVPIVCVGETLEERETGDTLEVVGGQLAGSLPPDAAGSDVVVAYEPVWAIGAGRVPSEHDIETVHRFIRARLEERLAAGAGVRILYGGSVTAENAAAIMAIPEVDGVLVGGASLDAAEFCRIMDAASEMLAKAAQNR